MMKITIEAYDEKFQYECEDDINCEDLLGKFISFLHVLTYNESNIKESIEHFYNTYCKYEKNITNYRSSE